ncbi:MAG TPA: TonB-dependent receptor [Ramlibacter sp.]|uniref:TonB-dependent receptor n=1 Tax=Ramlibacter sp. TaxID=1917967 RepID=UPI002BD3B140|nr:TonB-dependent receptor [Ramlibacter sp.]HVZ42263.1 TonB-dependent receptor [Ramlibacter sp.]
MRAAIFCGLLAAATGALAQQAGTALEPVTIQSTREDLQGTATSASEGIVTSKQLATRPLLRAGDIMESVPGLVATQHAGEGKANQYFLRGFNLDHGTDFATFVDGVPVNFPTHGHGQGYTDLYFLIPELVESVQYRKGPYYAPDGDFATAGSARIRTVRSLARPFALVAAGGFGFRRALAAGSWEAGEGDLLLAAEHSRDDGPWTVPQNLRKTNLTAKYSHGTAAEGFGIGFTHYEASWTSTDQVPERAIDSGLIGRFGSLDPTSGGRTRRTGANGTWNGSVAGLATSVGMYALRYGFDLFSDFTYYTRGCDALPLAPACDGTVPLDQFEQVDRRTVLGASVRQERSARIRGVDTVWSWGADVRRDNIGEVGLYDTQSRVRLATVRRDRVMLDAIGAWLQADAQFTAQWRGVFGLRWDHRTAEVASSIAANSGAANAERPSPKVSLAYTPTERLDFYANWGRGYHSNDARGAVIRVDPNDGVTPVDRSALLVPATGYEAGARTKWSDRLVTTAALWWLKLDSELVFAGDAGTTEASRPSSRRGLELTANWRPAPAWEFDADASFTRARYRDFDPAGDRIPGALARVGTLGVTYAQGPWTLGARVRHFGPHPLIEDNSIRAPGSTLANLRAAYRFAARNEVSIDVFNVFGRKVNDIEYAYASRLPGEPAFADGVTPATVHLHPSLPRAVRVGWKVGF